MIAAYTHEEAVHVAAALYLRDGKFPARAVGERSGRAPAQSFRRVAPRWGARPTRIPADDSWIAGRENTPPAGREACLTGDLRPGGKRRAVSRVRRCPDRNPSESRCP